MNELRNLEVSCKLLTPIFCSLKNRSLPIDKFTENSGYSTHYLQRASNRISWEAYGILVNNLTNKLGYNKNDLIEIGTYLEETTLFKGMMLIARILYTLPEFYEWLHSTHHYSPALQAVTCISYEIDSDKNNNYRLRFNLQKNYPGIWQFYYTSLGVIQILPTIYNLPPAHVDLEIFNGGCMYSFNIPSVGGKLSWLRKFFTSPLNAHKIAESLMYANAEIYEKNIDLQRENIKLIETQKALEKAIYCAEEASQAKSQFIANVSHELRTPLNGILGTVTLMLDEEDNPDKLSSLRIINDSSEMLLQLLNDVLSFSKLDSDAFTFKNEAFNLHQLLSDTIKSFKATAQLKKIDLLFASNLSPYNFYMGDGIKIKQIINNLISNAIKFCDAGHVKLNAEWDANTAMLTMAVSDTGIGIPKDQQKLVFEDFQQLDNKLNRKHEGTGLGLAITQKIITKMKGTIDLTSELGKGSTFTLTIPLPLTQAPNAIEITESIHLVKTLNILLVEDNTTNQLVISRIIQKIGHHVTIAANGIECLKAVKKQSFDLILMDLMMPEMDGIEATKALRQNYSKEKLPILALSANTDIDNIEKCLNAGMNDYVHKPIRMNELKAILSSFG